MQWRINCCKVFFFVLLSVSPFFLTAQDSIRYQVTVDEIDLNQHFSYWQDSTHEADFSSCLKSCDKYFQLKKDFSNAGVVRDIVWLKFNLTAVTDEEKIVYLSNPDIRKVTFLLTDKSGSVIKKVKEGRSVKSKEKEISTRYPAMKLELKKGNDYSLYVKLQNDNYPMYFPLSIIAEKDYYKMNTIEIIVEAAFIGLLSMTLLIVIGIFFWVKRIQFVYYGFALFMIIVFYMAESGFFIEFSASEWFQDRVKYVSTSVLMVFMTLFIREVVTFNTWAKYLVRFIWWMNVFHLLFAVMVLFVDVQNATWYNPVQLFYFLTVQLYGVVFLSALGVEAYAKNKMALYAFFAYVFFVVTSIVKMMVINGVMSYSWTVFAVLKLGSLIEVGIFNYLIFVQIKRWYDERNKLLLEVNSYQQDLLEALVKGEERERKRLSEELHDSVGSMLSALKLNLPSVKTLSSNLSSAEKTRIEKGVYLLDRTLNEVRNLSHSLQPPDLVKYGLEAELKQYTQRINDEKLKIHLRFDEWPQKIDHNLELALFRIVQEGVNNTVKHGEAQNLAIQFRGDINELILTIEDDGVGFDMKQKKDGIGIKNMKSRLSKFNASFHIESAPNQGTLIIVKVKLE